MHVSVGCRDGLCVSVSVSVCVSVAVCVSVSVCVSVCVNVAVCVGVGTGGCVDVRVSATVHVV